MKIKPKKTREVILKEALKMSPEDRAKISLALIESLDNEDTDGNADVDWQREIKQRLDDIDNGKVECLEWDITLEKLKSEL